jgi:hypothetical integral membrane protein (TIGR02206 family)
MAVSFAAVAMLVFIYISMKKAQKHKLMKAVAFTLLSCEICRAGWLICVGHYTLSESLPLQLSRIMLFIEAMAIFTDKRFFKEFSYACGLFAVAAFIAPNTQAYPIFHIHNLRYTVAHVLTMAVPLMWIAGDRFVPDIRYLPKSFLLLLGFAGLATAANIMFDANYLHIHHVPPHVNIEIGQPWYFLAMTGVIIGFWCITYIPWVIREIRLKKNTG